MSDLSSEVCCHVLRPFDHLRFVRQLDKWPYEGRPTPTSLPGCEILGYTMANGSRVSRVFFVTADEIDGLTMTPAPDKYGGVPVVPKTVACQQPPTLLATELECERLARADVVRYWRELVADKPAPPPAPAPKSFWSRLIGR